MVKPRIHPWEGHQEQRKFQPDIAEEIGIAFTEPTTETESVQTDNSPKKLSDRTMIIRGFIIGLVLVIAGLAAVELTSTPETFGWEPETITVCDVELGTCTDGIGNR